MKSFAFATLLFLLSFGFVKASTLNATQTRAINWVAKAPASYASIENLAGYLGGISADEYTKALAILCWEVKFLSYDHDSYENWKVGKPMADQSPATVLKTRKAVCQGYAELYEALCKLMGIECELISGYAKGASYFPGKHFETTNHAWNAVKIYGKWELVDATWADCMASGNVPKFFYFCASPRQLVASHVPKDSKWQLLSKPLQLAGFEGMPIIEPSYFENAIEDYTPHVSVIKHDGKPFQVFLKHGGAEWMSAGAHFIPADSLSADEFTFTTKRTNEGIQLTCQLAPEAKGKLWIAFGPEGGSKDYAIQFGVEPKIDSRQATNL